MQKLHDVAGMWFLVIVAIVEVAVRQVWFFEVALQKSECRHRDFLALASSRLTECMPVCCKAILTGKTIDVV